MNLLSCPECGVVVDTDNMVEVEFDEDRKIKNHYYRDRYEEGFYCPCCGKWVYTRID